MYQNKQTHQQVVEREFTYRKVRGSNPTSASRLPLSSLRQSGSNLRVQPAANTNLQYTSLMVFLPVHLVTLLSSATNWILYTIKWLSKELDSEYYLVHLTTTQLELRLNPYRIVSFSCNALPVPSCNATRRKQEGWDTGRTPNLGKGSRGAEVQ
ncbi:hypothetical protein T265_04636 [Opisthorchis viverrini]|uniref:Uncharacterized protein n=1 Tax=Opisthorchis viverrini TaxID=6198 RepID=A0A074ZMH9_OPIVI|nr:hypothetical protein T265_04636 [Opisthorchis viverrini]KER28593.1 hypothetical protein T265_04636 [Opisthorchis viverrini]